MFSSIRSEKGVSLVRNEKSAPKCEMVPNAKTPVARLKSVSRKMNIINGKCPCKNSYKIQHIDLKCCADDFLVVGVYLLLSVQPTYIVEKSVLCTRKREMETECMQERERIREGA